MSCLKSPPDTFISIPGILSDIRKGNKEPVSYVFILYCRLDPHHNPIRNWGNVMIIPPRIMRTKHTILYSLGISSGLYSHPRQNCLNINYHRPTVLSQSVLCNPTKQLNHTSQSPAATFLHKLCSPENREGFIHTVIEKTGKKNEKGGKGEEKGRARIAREILKFAQLAVYPKIAVN